MIRVKNRVALYARFSSDNQRSESIDAQVRAMQAYCKQHHFEIVQTYVDEAKSATTDRRPAFQQMVSDSAAHTFDILLVHKLDRFARNRYDSAVYKRELKKNGVAVYSVLENLDNSPESIMMEAVLEGMSEYYSQNLAREVMKGLRETALQCKHTGGKPPLGYDIDATTRQLAINPEEAETVRIIFDMYSKGYGYSPILETLHRQQRKTKKGQDFQKNSLHSILRNPKYQGIYIFNKSSAKSAAGTRNTHLYKDQEEIIAIEGGCPQIIPPDLYAKVQERLTENQRISGQFNAKERYLLSGRLYCKECGRSMTGNARHSGRDKSYYVTYRCATKRYCCCNREFNRDYLETYVLKLLEEKIFNAPALEQLCQRIQQWKDQPSVTARETTTQALAEVELALQNITDAIAKGLLSDVLVIRMHELEEKKKALQHQLWQEQAKQKRPAQVIDPVSILAQYEEVKGEPTSPMFKRFIQDYIDRIEVGRYIVSITLKTGLDLLPALDSTYEVRREEIYRLGKAG